MRAKLAGPKEIRDAIELLGVERIGHGIAAIHDRDLMDLLAERHIPLEICPESNVRTGALAKQLGSQSPHGLRSILCPIYFDMAYPW